jgi:hypothetical protein
MAANLTESQEKLPVFSKASEFLVGTAALTEMGAIREAYGTIEAMVETPAPRASTKAICPRYLPQSENKRYE